MPTPLRRPAAGRHRGDPSRHAPFAARQRAGHRQPGARLDRSGGDRPAVLSVLAGRVRRATRPPHNCVRCALADGRIQVPSRHPARLSTGARVAESHAPDHHSRTSICIVILKRQCPAVGRACRRCTKELVRTGRICRARQAGISRAHTNPGLIRVSTARPLTVSLPCAAGYSLHEAARAPVSSAEDRSFRYAMIADTPRRGKLRLPDRRTRAATTGRQRSGAVASTSSVTSTNRYGRIKVE
jgi:hypothetical protein